MNIKLNLFAAFILGAALLPFSAQSEAQERLVFDYYIAGAFQGTLPGTFTDDWIQLDNPRVAAERIPNLRDVSAIEKLLEGQIPTGLGRIISGVGTAVAEPNSFKINLTIDQSQLLFQRLEKTDRLTVPSDNLSFRVGARATGSTDFESGTDESLTLAKDITISKGRWRSNLNGTYDEGSGYNLSTFNVEHDVGTRTYGAGMLSTDGTLFSNSQQYYGFELKSNLVPIKNLSDFRASSVEIFVPTRSKVKVFRGETRIIFSRILNFGLQELDTSRFPTGSYPIKIVIEEDDGTTTEERRRFTKTSRIAAFGHPSYAFQIGLTRSEEELLSTPVFQFTRNWRYKDNLDLEVSLYGTDETLLTETKMTGLWDEYTFETALNTTTESDLALFGTIGYQKADSNWGWDLTGYHTITGFESDSTAFTTGNDFDQNINTSRSYFSGYLSYKHDDFNYRLIATRSSKPGQAVSYSYGPSIIWSAYNKNSHSIRGQFRYQETSDGTFAELTANYRWKPDLKLEVKSRVSRQRRRSQDINVTEQSVRYTNRTLSDKGIDIFLGNTYTKGNNHTNTTNLELLTVGKHLQTRWTGQERSAHSIEDSTSLDIEAQTNLLFTKGKLQEGDFTLTPERTAESSLIIELTGDARGTEMEILVNDRPYGYGRVGETITLGLPPYKDYEITLQPKNEEALYRYPIASKRITLYPGNIEKMSWDISRLILVLGRIVNLTGTPLEWENIKGLESLFSTDGAGNFQLEMAVGESAYIQSSQNSCTIALPPMPKTEYFFHVGDIVCG